MSLPKEIYVKRESDGNSGESWLNAQTALIELVEMGIEESIGIYKLVEVKKFRGTATAVTKVHRHKKSEK